ncbi:putative nucleoside diphosphate kinase [Plectropomus leopardus]|uniref:putative nucleoside diphosphate kinase n=1 Tax=Plectropomus leopardus TaxID=160734 RepID=UPI001C4A91CB|nr:putative nucleoside diphosphate kinase [Plectropomus leopardus]
MMCFMSLKCAATGNTLSCQQIAVLCSLISVLRKNLPNLTPVSVSPLQPSEELLQEHYIDLKERPFFPGLIKYMSSGPVVAMVWEGKGAVKTGRVMLGATNPADSLPGTIRGDFCIDVSKNIIHGSDSVESANKEIALWFKDDLVSYTSCAFDWLY